MGEWLKSGYVYKPTNTTNAPALRKTRKFEASLPRVVKKFCMFVWLWIEVFMEYKNYSIVTPK